MATESFYEDMVIDTPEKAAAIEELFAHPEKYTYHCTGKINFKWATREEMDRFMAKFMEQGDDSGDKNDNSAHDVSVRVDPELRRATRLQDGSELRVRAREGEPRCLGISPRERHPDGEEGYVQDVPQHHRGSGDSGVRHARHQMYRKFKTIVSATFLHSSRWSGEWAYGLPTFGLRRTGTRNGGRRPDGPPPRRTVPGIRCPPRRRSCCVRGRNLLCTRRAGPPASPS